MQYYLQGGLDMKKIVALCLPILLICSISLATENSDKPSLWSKMRSKIEMITPKKKTASAAVVGGVRSAKEEDGSDLYWKGENLKLSATPEELEAFKQALQLADKDEKKAAQEAFDKFINTYPESELLPDARQALQLLAAGE